MMYTWYARDRFRISAVVRFLPPLKGSHEISLVGSAFLKDRLSAGEGASPLNDRCAIGIEPSQLFSASAGWSSLIAAYGSRKILRVADSALNDRLRRRRMGGAP